MIKNIYRFTNQPKASSDEADVKTGSETTARSTRPDTSLNSQPTVFVRYCASIVYNRCS
jgi:hypothetical protein